MKDSMKKQLLIIFALGSLCTVRAMDVIKDKRCVVYSHGFGEDGDGKSDFIKCFGSGISAPIYPDAPGAIKKAVFYTKPSIHVLADHLYDKVITGDNESVVLIGRSCGAGTVINCLEKLINYDADYFENSKIKSQDDASQIVAAVNKGALINVVPFLSVRKANAIAVPSAVVAGLTVVVATATAYRLGSSSFDGNIEPEMTKVGFLAAGALVYSAFADYLKKIYANIIVHFIVTRISNDCFDSRHEDPLQSVEKLRGKLNCPILLQFAQNDEVLEGPDKDTIKVYDALKGKKTHIVITKEGWHNELPKEFFDHLNCFKKTYLSEKSEIVNDTFSCLAQPTVAQLRESIYPRDIKSVLSRNKF